MSALPPIADLGRIGCDVRLVPIADIAIRFIRPLPPQKGSPDTAMSRLTLHSRRDVDAPQVDGRRIYQLKAELIGEVARKREWPFDKRKTRPFCGAGLSFAPNIGLARLT